MMNFARKKLILLSSIIFSFVVILIMTFLFAEHLSRKNAPEKLSEIISKVNLIDHNGQAFKSTTLKNKPSLLFFGFTNAQRFVLQHSPIYHKLQKKLHRKMIQ